MSRVRAHIDTEHANAPDLLRALTVTWIPRDLPPLPCREDPELFWPESWTRTAEDRARVNEARDLCRECPVRSACLEAAIEGREWGIWGGTSEVDRERMRRHRASASRDRAASA